MNSAVVTSLRRIADADKGHTHVIYIYIYIYMYICVCTCKTIHIHIYIGNICIRTSYTHICIHTYIHSSIHPCKHISIDISVQISIHPSIHLSIHTHTLYITTSKKNRNSHIIVGCCSQNLPWVTKRWLLAAKLLGSILRISAPVRV